jgi:amino acid permease
VFVITFRSIQYQFFTVHTPPVWEPIQTQLFNFNLQLFVAFPILAIAFAFHMNIAPVQMELKNATSTRVQLACSCAVLIGTALYLIMGIFGYLRFGKDVKSNVLKSFLDPGDVLVQIGRIAFLLVVTTAFPLIVYPCRMNLRTLFFRTLKRDNLFHVVSTVCLVVTAYGVAISGVSLGLVFGVLGATCGNFLIYSFPGLLYVKVREILVLIGKSFFFYFFVSVV